MKPRKFNPFMAAVNAEWAASVLQMQVNPCKGPDLISDQYDLELKFTLITPIGRSDYPKAWTVLEHQMDYQDTKQMYWGLGTYILDRPIASIRATEISRLESFVVERQLFIVRYDWMQQYRPHETQGKTKFSSWNNTLRYPKLKDLPKSKLTIQVTKGRVHLTKGIDENHFTFS